MNISKYFMGIFRKPVSLSITIYRSFFFFFSRANRATKTSFRPRIVSFSIRSPQTSITGRFGPISHFLPESRYPTCRLGSRQSFRLLVRDPSLGHTKPSCLGFLAKLFILFSIFDISLHSFCLPTHLHPAIHLLQPTY